MKLPHQQRNVRPAVEIEIRHAAFVDVVADHVAILGGRGGGQRVNPGETASEIKLMRRAGLDGVARGAEILLGGFGVKGGQIRPGFGRIGRGAIDQQGVPRVEIGPPGGVELGDLPILGPQVGEEHLFGRLIGAGLERRHGDGSVVAPGHLVVGEIAEAPRVAGGFIPGALHGTLQPARERGVKDVGELAPIALAALDHARAAGADAVGVGCQAQRAEGGIGPVADGVKPPTAQALLRHARKEGSPLRSVFARQVGLAKREAIGGLPLIAAHDRAAAGEKLLKLGPLAGKILEPGLPSFNGRLFLKGHAIHAVGEEQAAVRVHQPPFALVFFRAEKAGGLELRAGPPAPEFVPFFRPRPGGQVRGFGGAFGRQIGQRLRFARPILVAVLAKRVNKRKKRRGVGGPGGRRGVVAGGMNIGDGEELILLGFGHEYQQLRHVGGIHGVRSAARDRVALHAEESAFEFVVRRSFQHHVEFALLSRRQGHFPVGAMVLAIRPRIIRAAGDGDGIGTGVFDRKNNLAVRRKVPMPLGRGQGDARPVGLVSGGHLQGRLPAEPGFDNRGIGRGDIRQTEFPKRAEEGKFQGVFRQARLAEGAAGNEGESQRGKTLSLHGGKVNPWDWLSTSWCRVLWLAPALLAALD